MKEVDFIIEWVIGLPLALGRLTKSKPIRALAIILMIPYTLATLYITAIIFIIFVIRAVVINYVNE